jgi:hypothetical protein
MMSNAEVSRTSVKSSLGSVSVGNLTGDAGSLVSLAHAMLTAKHGGCMKQHLFEHRHAISSWLTVRLTHDTMKTVLVVETDLMLNVQDPDFDGDDVNSLLTKVQEYLRANRHIDCADIEPIVD